MIIRCKYTKNVVSAKCFSSKCVVSAKCFSLKCVVSAKCLVFAVGHEQTYTDEEMNDQVPGDEKGMRAGIGTESHIVDGLDDWRKGLDLIERVMDECRRIFYSIDILGVTSVIIWKDALIGAALQVKLIVRHIVAQLCAGFMIIVFKRIMAFPLIAIGASIDVARHINALAILNRRHHISTTIVGAAMITRIHIIAPTVIHQGDGLFTHDKLGVADVIAGDAIAVKIGRSGMMNIVIDPKQPSSNAHSEKSMGRNAIPVLFRYQIEMFPQQKNRGDNPACTHVVSP